MYMHICDVARSMKSYILMVAMNAVFTHRAELTTGVVEAHAIENATQCHTGLIVRLTAAALKLCTERYS